MATGGADQQAGTADGDLSSGEEEDAIAARIRSRRGQTGRTKGTRPNSPEEAGSEESVDEPDSPARTTGRRAAGTQQKPAAAPRGRPRKNRETGKFTLLGVIYLA